MKKIVSFVSITAIIVVFFGIMTSASTYPNWGHLYENGLDLTGYVQHKPSYADSSNNYDHAMQGRVRLIVESWDDYSITYSGYAYTVLATSINDSSLHTAEKEGIYMLRTNNYAQYSFFWHSGGNWKTDLEVIE